MYALFGVCSHSLPAVLERVKKTYTTFIVEEQYASREDLRRAARGAQVLLFGSWNAYVGNLYSIRRYRGVGIIFETPLRLAEVPEAVLLDTQQGASWQFRFRPVDWLRFLSTTRAAFDRRRHIQVNLVRVNHLARVIQRQHEGRYLSRFNTTLYAITDHTNREDLRRRLVRWLCSLDGAEQFDSGIAFRSERASMLADFLRYIEEEGAAFRLALHGAAEIKDRGKTPNFKRIAKDFGVDSYELRYIIKNYAAARSPRGPRNVLFRNMAQGYTSNNDRERAAAAALATPAGEAQPAAAPGPVK